MRISHIWGGLANQMLIYIFSRFIEETTGEKVIFDDLTFKFSGIHVHNGYELDRIFNIKSEFLSEFISPDAKDEVRKSGPYEYLKCQIPSLRLVAELPVYIEWMKYFYNLTITPIFDSTCYSIPRGSFFSSISKLKGDLYYIGIWESPLWFHSIRDKMLEELRFPEFDDVYNKEQKERILNTNSIGVHIRRGDMLHPFPILDMKYYRMAIAYMRNAVLDPAFYLFTDDKKWVTENYLSLGLEKNDRITFVTENTGYNSYKDMQLMTSCRNLVLANSTFSQVSSLLNQTPGKIVLRPDKTLLPY